MSSSLRRALYRLGIALGSALFICQIWKGFKALKGFSLILSTSLAIFGAWIAVFFSYGLQIAAWNILMIQLNVHLPWRQVVKGYTMTFLPRYIPGSLWAYLSRSQWLYQMYQIPYSLTNFGSIVEVIIAVVTASLATGIYFLSISKGGFRITLLITICIIPLLVWLLVRWLSEKQIVQRIMLRNRTLNKIPQIRIRYWLLAVILYMLSWLGYGSSLLLLLRAFDFPLASNVLESTFMFSISWLVGFLIFIVPSGLGFRELSLSNLVASRLGLLPTQASAIAVACRFLISLAEVGWILIGQLLSKTAHLKSIKSKN
jgi:uncharacterized membrane protein YbhN (UPF0104 family)